MIALRLELRIERTPCPCFACTAGFPAECCAETVADAIADQAHWDEVARRDADEDAANNRDTEDRRML